MARRNYECLLSCKPNLVYPALPASNNMELGDVINNIRESLPHVQCQDLINYAGQRFIRLQSSVCDQHLVYDPLVEIVVTSVSNEELCVTRVNYKKDVMDKTVFNYSDEDSVTGTLAFISYINFIVS